MKTHMLMVWIVTGLMVSCTRKLDQQPVHPTMEPAGSSGDAVSATDEATKANDDTSDLANQLRDPNLLDRLEDPNLPDSDNSASKSGSEKANRIKGAELPPEPIDPTKSTPEPPLGKPELPGGNDQKPMKSTPSGN